MFPQGFAVAFASRWARQNNSGKGLKDDSVLMKSPESGEKDSGDWLAFLFYQSPLPLRAFTIRQSDILWDWGISALIRLDLEHNFYILKIRGIMERMN
jgi:hypothetical protein